MSMHNNEILRRLAESLAFTDARLVSLFALGGVELGDAEARAFTGDPKAEGAAVCSDELLTQLLDGLIIEQRGPREPGAPVPEAERRLTNNEVLKKLRIALKLQEDDVLKVLAAGGSPMANRELTTLFRKPGNKHYRRCVDDVLASFLTGLGNRDAATGG